MLFDPDGSKEKKELERNEPSGWSNNIWNQESIIFFLNFNFNWSLNKEKESDQLTN
jgi:hypothetical protein